MFRLMRVFWIITITSNALIPSAHADVYKCVINGKTVYSDSRCAYQPGIIKTNPEQNNFARVQPPSTNNSYINDSASNNPSTSSQECADKLYYINQMTQSLGEGDFRERRDKVNKRNAARYEYESTCLSASNRESLDQQRSNNKLSRQLRDIERTQKEIQFKQRGY